MFCKAKSKLYRLSLGPKSNNMFIRITAAIDSWFCFQIWFCQVLVKWHCNSLLLLSRLTRVTKKLQKPSLWIWNWISHRDCRKVSWPWLVNRVAWATGLVNCWKQFHFLIESTMENWIRKRVLSCCLKITSPRISWKWNEIYKKEKKPCFENIQHAKVVKESKSLNSISTERGFLTFYLDLAFPRICGRV